MVQRGLNFEQQKPLPIVYKGVPLDVAYRLDLLVERKVIIEIKAVDSLTPLHKAQLISYLKLTDLELGLLINFNVPVLKDGIQRVIVN